MSWLDRIFGRAPADPDEKAAVVPFVAQHRTLPLAWNDTPTFEKLSTQGFRANSAVNQVVQRLAIGYSEPRPQVLVRDEPVERHPLQLLLNRPNPVMSHAELMTIVIHYKAIGGNCYLHKVRNRSKQVIELWPYHAGQMWPVASRFGWVEEYEYDAGDGQKQRVPASEVIHLKWPLVDLQAPWLGLAPLLGVAREVDSDTEMTRYLLALLQNDAATRGVITMPAGTALSPTQADKLRASWEYRHGGANRGRVAILEQGATYERTSLNMQELAWEALRRIPESRIAGAFGVPAILAGLYVGLEKATYANFKEAREQLTQDTYVPLWKSDSQEYTQALSTEYSDNPVVEYDLSEVAALSEDEDARVGRGVQLFTNNIAMKNEIRGMLGLEDVPGGMVFADGSGPDALPAPEPIQPIIDVQPVVPPQLVDGKRRQRKARDPLERETARMERALNSLFNRAYEGAADSLNVEQLGFDFVKELELVARRFYPLFVSRAYSDAGKVVGMDIAFDLNNPRVQELMAGALKRLTGSVPESVKDTIRTILRNGTEAGWSIDELSAAIVDQAPDFSLNRARLVSRTESGTMYNLGGVAYYQEAGITHVDVLDGDEDEPCKSANGSRWTLEQAQENPLGHPNCQRAFAPVVA